MASRMKPFKPNAYPTMGVEQEFHLIDPQTGQLAPRMEEVWNRLEGWANESACYELILSVIEMRSRVCHTADQLLDDVIQSRRDLAEACRQVGVLAVAAGSHPYADWTNQPIVQTEHYRWLAEHYVDVARRLIAFGLHVHVGMRSADGAMYAMRQMCRWVYPLLALSANSPFLDGRRTGLASTRQMLMNAMPRTMTPPDFHSFAELEAYYGKLHETRDVARPGDLWWAVRIQPPLGTIEFRCFDLPTDVRRAAALAAVIQAAMATLQDDFESGREPERLVEHYLDQNRWKATRYDLDAPIIEPHTGEILTMREQLLRLFDRIEPKAKELESDHHLAFARHMLTAETESRQQVRFYEQNGRDLRQLELELARRTMDF